MNCIQEPEETFSYVYIRPVHADKPEFVDWTKYVISVNDDRVLYEGYDNIFKKKERNMISVFII